ncbi:MAG: sulfotransferase [Gracilimonas sp.]|uniref:sulfotransferase n=1 Tax=Gracilimonas sp. TaxID=1974203 RepID=UPI00199B88E5|nr:sulfotransferase [Gracilimonas sp.]MBD3614992.1 sulfotransferase [Gracilimonas sp.]
MRKDQEVSDKYKKNQDFELALSLMNKKLHESEQELIAKLPESYPTIHIIGAPRSGTTLAVQQLAEGLKVGYINNLIAAFWKAPLFGIHLSKQLLKDEYHSSFKSTYGRTSGIQEPHEFGYFWNYHLKYDEFYQQDSNHEAKIDWDYLTTLIKNMCEVYDRPILFKSFLYGFHALKAQKILQKTCFIYIRRDLMDNALSILKMRKKYLGDSNEWASIKPKQFDILQERNIYQQIIGQILFLEYEYINQLKELPKKNRLIINYEDMCDNPSEFINNVHSLLKPHYKGLKQSEILSENEIQRKAYDDQGENVENFEKAIKSLIHEFPKLKVLTEARKDKAQSIL